MEDIQSPPNHVVPHVMSHVTTDVTRTHWQSFSPVRSSSGSGGSNSSHSNGYLDTAGYHGNPHCSPASSTYHQSSSPASSDPSTRGYLTPSSPPSPRSLTDTRGYLTPTSPPSPRSITDSVVATSSVYMDTKTSMLEIIEEGLNLKLEIQNIKDQFLTLIEDLDKFDTPESRMKTSPAPLPGSTPGTPASGGKQKPLSSTRARVRALYEARKARIMAKRAASTDFTANPKQAKKVCQEGDKENLYTPSSSGRKPQVAPRNLGKVTSKKLLTPIREERDRKLCINNNVVCSPRTPLSDIEGDYVTLRSPAGKGDLHVTPKSRRSMPTSPAVACKLDETSIWADNSPDVCPDPGVTRLSNADLSPIAKNDSLMGKHDSPKFASSDAISELYTSKVLKDISTISSTRNQTLREQVSSGNLPGNPLDGALHSTFNYPLHSTMNYPLHSTINFFDDAAGSKMSPKSGVTSSTRIASDATSAIRSKSRREISQGLIAPPVTPSTPQSRLPSRQLSPSDFRTPTRKVQATLCKEHGLHPYLGGPCIFQTDDPLTQLDSSSSLEDEPEARRPYLDTDCDSSYLSECVDDVTLSQGEEFTATYDARTARMRMLKRQTGQTELQREEPDMRYPIGLSESDLNFDITRKHLSLEATRASLPDLSGLSTLPSEEESESTLHASSRRPGDSTDDILSQNETLVSVSSGGAPRPLSVATTDDSPESTASLQVPVNSPNITDSGGSSSRPTTDTYDYVELPIKTKSDNQFKVPTLPPPKPRRQMSSNRTQSSSQYRSHSDSKSLRSYKSHKSAKSGRSSKSHQPSVSRDEWGSSPGRFGSHSRLRPDGGHFDIIDTQGTKRTVVQHLSVSKNLQPDRKKQLVKRLKQFNNNFNRTDSNTNLHIKTLGHF